MNNKLALAFAISLFASRPVLAVDDHGHDHDHAPSTAPSAATTKPAAGEHGEHDHDHNHKDEHGDKHDHEPATAPSPAPAKAVDEHDGHDHDHEKGHGDDHAAPAAKDKHDHAKGEAKHDDHDDHAHEGEGHSDEVTIMPDAMERNGVKLGKAERRVLNGIVVAPGRLAFDAEAMAHVGSAVTGRASEIKVRVGDTVKKGDELLIIESAELGEAQSALLQARTSLVVAKAAVEPTKNAYERAKALHEKSDGIALAEVQKRDAEFRAATGAAQNAEETFAAAANRLRLFGMTAGDVSSLVQSGRINPTLSIKAPLGGTVIEREVTLGELVAPDKERLLVIAATDPLWVLADVPESRLGDIAVGATADVSIVALTGAKVTGKVSHVAPSLDADTRTVRVRIDVANPGGKLRPGMFARVAIAGTSNDEPVVVVPDEAVQTVEGAPAVFVPVANEPNTFAKRAVKVGKSVGGLVPILDGLKDGEPLVTAGSFILKADLGKSGAAHEH